MTPDKLGRIVIPPSLRAYTGLQGEVMVAGVNSWIEIWDRATWKADESDADPRATATPQRLRAADRQSAELGVSRQ